MITQSVFYQNSNVRSKLKLHTLYIIPPLVERGLYCNHLVRLSVRLHFRNRYLSFYWKKWFYIWYMAFAWWIVPCLPFPGLPHIYFLFTVRLRIVHACRNEKTFVTDISASTGRNDFIFDIWFLHGDSPFQVTVITKTFSLWLHKSLVCTFQPVYNDLCRVRCFRLVCDPFSDNECWDIYKFDTNERVGVFLARRSVQHLVDYKYS